MTHRINVPNFSLTDTVECGQAFRWISNNQGWYSGVVGERVIRVQQTEKFLQWNMFPSSDLNFIKHYFCLDVPLQNIIRSFPKDETLQKAVNRHRGLRLIRQEPWECLASFIASSTKQIVQIRQIISNLAVQFGKSIETANGVFHTFPSAAVIASCSHQQLRDCKLGFRAKYLLATAQAIENGAINLEKLSSLELDHAREELTKLPGVGDKIACCVLLFSCGFHQAFPIDVWIERALRRIYFADNPKVKSKELREFTRSYFGPYAGWAQQYLFSNERANSRKNTSDLAITAR